MVVVPALSEGEHRDNDIVRALITGDKWSLAPGVTDRVHRKCSVLKKEDAHQTGPDQRLDPPCVASRNGKCDQIRKADR